MNTFEFNFVSANKIFDCIVNNPPKESIWFDNKDATMDIQCGDITLENNNEHVFRSSSSEQH